MDEKKILGEKKCSKKKKKSKNESCLKFRELPRNNVLGGSVAPYEQQGVTKNGNPPMSVQWLRGDLGNKLHAFQNLFRQMSVFVWK